MSNIYSNIADNFSELKYFIKTYSNSYSNNWIARHQVNNIEGIKRKKIKLVVDTLLSFYGSHETLLELQSTRNEANNKNNWTVRSFTRLYMFYRNVGYRLQSNLTHLPRHEFVPGVGMGIAKCPYDPADNSTAVWVEKGNPGDLPALYSGTNAEFTKADTVIFRTDLYNLTTGRKAFSFKRTLKYDSKWLDSKCNGNFFPFLPLL